MKLVIEIPEEEYRIICKEPFTIIGKAIKNGALLPKGHGKLIDADAIKPINAPIAPLTPEGAVHYEWVYMKSEIDRAPTIIEADKEGEQE